MFLRYPNVPAKLPPHLGHRQLDRRVPRTANSVIQITAATELGVKVPRGLDTTTVKTPTTGTKPSQTTRKAFLSLL